MTRPAIPHDIMAYAAAALVRKIHGPGALPDTGGVPTYITDEDGLLVYANDACEAFAGRKPVVGEDRWCVTWKLYTQAGEYLPHDQCPMAVAIKEGRPVRGAAAVAERPDGTRAPFRPFPTPIFGTRGQVVGAVNMLLPG
jgi:PAS domain-containing protein